MLTDALGALRALPRAGAAVTQVDSVSIPLALLTVPAPPVIAQAQLVLGVAQPEAYVYVGRNQGLAIWGHADIVQSSVMDPAG